jgi:hypothetical protein
LLKGITRALGPTLDVRRIFAPLGDAILPALDFNAMGVALLASGSQEFVLFGEVRETPLARPAHVYLKDFSFAEALEAEPRRGASPCAVPHIDVHFRTRSLFGFLHSSAIQSPRKRGTLSCSRFALKLPGGTTPALRKGDQRLKNAEPTQECGATSAGHRGKTWEGGYQWVIEWEPWRLERCRAHGCRRVCSCW